MPSRKRPTKKPARRRVVTPKKAQGAAVRDVSWHDAFIAAFEVSGNVRLASKAAGVSRTESYREYKTDAAFAARWDEAKENAVDMLEAEARRRSLAQSDTLLIFLLKSHRPAVYRERVDVKHGGKIEVADPRETALQQIREWREKRPNLPLETLIEWAAEDFRVDRTELVSEAIQ